MSGGIFMWNLLGINEDLHLILNILALIILLIIFIAFILGIRKRRVPKVKQIPLDTIYLENLSLALGTSKNIKGLSSEHQRLKVIVNDVKQVDSKKLSELSIPTFLKGKELTLLIKNHTKEVLSYLDDKIREGN